MRSEDRPIVWWMNCSKTVEMVMDLNKLQGGLWVLLIGKDRDLSFWSGDVDPNSGFDATVLSRMVSRSLSCGLR